MLDDISEQVRAIITGCDHDDVAAGGMPCRAVHRHSWRDRLRVSRDRLKPPVFTSRLHSTHAGIVRLTAFDEVGPVRFAETTLAVVKYGTPCGATQPM
jgi:hypothetical protein